MRTPRGAFFGFLLVVLVGASIALGACAQEDVSAIKKDVEAIKADMASLKASAQKTEPALTELKSGIEVLQVANLSDRGFDPNDANHARDAHGRGSNFVVQRISKGAIQMDVSVLRQPSNKTLYLFLQVTPERGQAEWVRAGEIKTDDQGRGSLQVNIPRPPGVYQVAGIASNVDKETPPYTERVYTCVPSVRVQVVA